MSSSSKTGWSAAFVVLWAAAMIAALSLPTLAQEDWAPRYVPPQSGAQAQPAPATQASPPATAPSENLNVGNPPPAVSPAPSPAAPVSIPGSRKLAGEVDVSGAPTWTDTGLDVQPGDKVTVNASGQVSYVGKSCGPEGLARGWLDLIRSLPVNAAGTAALIGKIGQDDNEVPFLVGAKQTITASHGGRLYLGLNLAGNDTVEGSFHAKITIAAGKAASASTATAIKLDPGLLAKIPRRVLDDQGNAGDMVNFVMLGTEDKVTAAFAAAGWVQVDRSKQEAVLHAILSTLSKDAYVQMPMSELYLFGRAQDYGFARAEPVAVVARRHHLRLWKTPLQVNGQTLWAGAATHDLGFEKDQRTGGVTHHIDPAVDDEREFVGQTLNATGLLSGLDHATPADALKGDWKTATGGEFHSDGQMLVIVLK